MIKRAVLVAIVALGLSNASAEAAGIVPILKDMATQAYKAAGSELGKSAVDYFKSLFNRNKELAEIKKKPQLSEVESKGKERNWVISPAGDLSKSDIQEIAKTLKSLDQGRNQSITATVNNEDRSYSTVEITTTEIANTARDGNFQISGGTVTVNILGNAGTDRQVVPQEQPSSEHLRPDDGARTPKAPPAEIMDRASVNVDNSYFVKDLLQSEWEDPWLDHGATGKFKLSKKSLAVTIEKAGRAFSDVQVYSYGHVLEPAREYVLRLVAQSNKECEVLVKFHHYLPSVEDANAQEPQFSRFQVLPGNNELHDGFTSSDLKKKLRFTIFYGSCEDDTTVTISKLDLAKRAGSSGGRLLLEGASEGEDRSLRKALDTYADVTMAKITIAKSARDDSRNVRMKITYRDKTDFEDSFNTPEQDASGLILSRIDGDRREKQ